MAESIKKLEAKAERAKEAIARIKHEGEIQGHAIAGTITEIVTGGVMGALEEYWGEGAIMGADIPLIVGIPTAALAIFGVGGEPTETANAMLRSVGNACLTIESYKKGGQLTQQWAAQRAA